MKQGIKKHKFKTALVALLAGGLVACANTCSQQPNVSENEDVKTTETVSPDLSVEAIKGRIEILNDHIKIFNRQLEAKDLNPEERFELRQAITLAQSEIYELQQELARRQDNANKTISFETARDGR